MHKQNRISKNPAGAGFFMLVAILTIRYERCIINKKNYKRRQEENAHEEK